MSKNDNRPGRGEDIALMSRDEVAPDLSAAPDLPAAPSPSAGLQKANNAETIGGAADPHGDTKPHGGRSTGSHTRRGGRKASKMSGNRRKYLIVGISALAVVLVCVIAAAFIVIGRIAVPVTVEVGDVLDLSPFTEGFAGKVCRVDGADGIPTDKVGEHSLTLTFFGFVRRTVPVSVRDTVAPELEVQNVAVAAGIGVAPEDFVVRASDLTALTFRFAEDLGEGELSGSVEKDVVIIAADEGGNETSKTAHLTANSPSLSVSAEFGASADEVRDMLLSRCSGIGKVDLSKVDVTACGEYEVNASDGDTYYRLRVVIRDTIAPTADVRSLDLRLGEEVVDGAILGEVTDLSPVTVSVDIPEDYKKAGTYSLPIILEDDQGNRTELEAEVRIHDVPQRLEVERGITTEELAALLLNGDGTLSLAAGFDAAGLALGQNNVSLKGAYNDLTTIVTVKDTTPPVLVTKDHTVIANRGVSPENFVASCTDASAVSYSFEGSVSAMTAGESKITVVATDEAGNQTKKQATLIVLVDSVPPVIHGVKNITLELGGSASYSNGVYAVDDIDGNVAVSVDASAVNTAVAGSYTVRYTATDRSGNTARASATVTVAPIGLNSVYSMADTILAQITTPGMSPREKAWAIYSWCSGNIRYSTSTSYLMGNFIQGAYSGFRTRAGNCYIYYAVASCLLTRSGITNMEISRNDPANPHYWNLVQIDGSWYHFDTCPHYRYAPLTSFLLTDAQVAAYSANSAPGYYSFDKSKYPRTP